ncbi:MAG: carbohydrate-binding domain-containing protein, partial [Clostridia bacterium]|nr:carbohydrate-binding domain-containing protein [Clostridia bacterium]
SLKCFVWNGMTPVSEVYETGTSQTTPTETAAPASYTAAFDVDDGVSSIDIYYTQDYTSADETNVSTAYARDSSTGEISTSGGQINFAVNLKDGYEISSVTATDGTYNKINAQGNNIYRVTKVNSDTTITVTTKQASEGDGIIHLNGTSINASGVEGATANGTALTLAASEDAYKIEGTLTDGSITVVKNAGDVTLEFVDDVSVTSSTAAALSAKSGANITLVADEGVKASFSSAAKKAIDGNGDIIINGDGEIEAVTTSQKNAIGGNTVTISGSGTVTVNSQKHGIEGAESVTISDSPTINVTSYGDGIRSDSAPAVATDGTVAASTTVTGGTVTINGGTINITSTSYIEETTDTETNITTTETKTGDGIQADTLLAINGGTITIDAAGEAVKAGFSQLDVADATDYSTYASKLSEYNGCVVITGGTLNAAADEDGIKAAKDVTISGGNVTVTEAGDDGIQAGDVVSSVSGSTVTFGKIDGTVTVSGSNTVVDIKKAAGDGIAA